MAELACGTVSSRGVSEKGQEFEECRMKRASERGAEEKTRVSYTSFLGHASNLPVLGFFVGIVISVVVSIVVRRWMKKKRGCVARICFPAQLFTHQKRNTFVARWTRDERQRSVFSPMKSDTIWWTQFRAASKPTSMADAYVSRALT